MNWIFLKGFWNVCFVMSVCLFFIDFVIVKNGEFVLFFIVGSWLIFFKILFSFTIRSTTTFVAFNFGVVFNVIVNFVLFGGGGGGLYIVLNFFCIFINCVLGLGFGFDGFFRMIKFINSRSSCDFLFKFGSRRFADGFFMMFMFVFEFGVMNFFMLLFFK